MRSGNKLAASAAAAVIFLVGCGGGGGGGGASPTPDPSGAISPSDANALTQAIAVKLGNNQAVLVAGDLPSSSTDANAPVLQSSDTPKVVAAGETVTLDIDVTSGTELSALFAKIPGALDLFQVSVPSSSGKLDTALSLAVEIPANVGEGSFCFDIKVRDAADLVSNAAQACVQVGEEPVASGCDVNEYSISGTDFVLVTRDEGIVVDEARSPLSGQLTVTEDSCEFEEVAEGYAGSCSISGSVLTVNFGQQFTGTISGGSFTLSTSVSSSTNEDELTEFVTAQFKGTGQAACEPSPIAAGTYSISGQEVAVSSPDPQEEVQNTNASVYSVSGTLTVTADGRCSATTSEGGWTQSECEISGNQISVFDGVYSGTIGPNSVTLVYNSPQNSEGEKFYGYLNGRRN